MIEKKLTISVSVGPAQPYALARNKSEGAIRFHEREQNQNFDSNIPNTYQNAEGSRPYPNGAGLYSGSNPTDTGYASDVCDYSIAKKNSSPIQGSSRGVGQIKLDDSYLQQKRPISMVSPSLKPISPSLESSLCDRRQQVIQHRAKMFMNDNNSSNTIDNNRFTNNNHFSSASTNRANFISGFTSAAAIVEVPKLTAARQPYFPSLPPQPDYRSDFYGAHPSLTMLETYAVNNPAYIPPTNQAYNAEPISDHFAPLYFQANENELSDDQNREQETIRTSSRNSKSSSNSGVRAKIARRKLMRQANSVDAVTRGVTDPDGSEAYDEEDSVEEKQDSESMNDFNSLKPKALSTLAAEDSSSSMYSSGEWTPETARKNWNFRFANIKHSFNAASEEDIATKSRSPSLHRPVNETEERGRNKFKSISPTKRSSFSSSTEFSDRTTPASERAQSKEDKNKLNAAMTASSKGYSSETGSIGPLPSSVVGVGPKRSAPDLYAQSKSKQPTPVRETLTSGRLSKSVPREGYDDHRAEVLGFVKAGEGPSNKGGDMDYQEYMNIINKVRKSKELERVRTEQLRLASMYAREKKRQEELKKEDDRLRKERIKIDMEKNEQPQTNLAPVTRQQPLIANPAVSIRSNNNNNTNSNNLALRANEMEKGQLDNKEVEMKKASPQRKSNEDMFYVAPVEVVKKPQQPLTNFQPKHFVPGPSSSDVPKPLPIEKPLTIQASNSYANINSFIGVNSNSIPALSVVDGRAEREEQLRMEQMWLEQRRQQVKVEQENLERLREEQLRQEKEREEIRRLEIERLRQIQEEQRRLEEERRRQEEQMRMEQMRLEEERRRQEKLQAEKNAEYNRQRLDIEAKNIAALQEEQRAARERQRHEQQQQQQVQQHHVSFGNSTEFNYTPQEKLINDRLVKQEKLREEHKREEAKIRQEKLNLINQEEMLIKRQEDMLKQIEAERENLAKQELLIRTRQQDRLKQVRQEKLLLEKQEETLLLREQQLIQEKIRQEKLREEQRVLREQEEAIRKRQEEISKELMEEISVSDDITVCQALEGQVFRGPTKSILMPPNDFQSQLSPRIDHNHDSKASTSPPPLQYIPPMNEMLNNDPDLEQVEEDGEGSYYSGSESDEDTLDEDGYYESKVEVKQNATSVPTTVRTIETKIDNPPWAPVTPYLCYPEKHSVSHAQEEISAIFSQCKTSQYTKDGVVTSPESMRTSTNLITTPESSISLHSQVSQTEPRSRQSSFSPPPLPSLPTDEVQTDLFLPVQPDVPPRDDSYLVYSSAAESSSVMSMSETTNKKDLLDTSSCSSSTSQLSPRLGGPGSAFKPYASSENLFDPVANKHMQELPPMAPTHNYPLRNGDTIGDSRYLLKMQNGSRDDFRGPVHGKVRELRKQPVKAPFSTTDTEPEMRECHLSTLDSRKKGSKKQIVYSTSETEEEYQAYLRSKPKWHGKGGHKDSWDPLLIQSPPQITQKPVGVIPKPQAALAVAAVPVIERGVYIAPGPTFEPVSVAPPFHMKENSVPENYVEKAISNVQHQHHEESKLPMQAVQFPITERVQKSNSIVEVRKIDQSLPLSVAEINRKSIIESQGLETALNSSHNFSNQVQRVETADKPSQSLSAILKQSLDQQQSAVSNPSKNSQLAQSIKPPPFMAQNNGGREEKEVFEIMSNKFPQSPLVPRAIRTPTSKLVSEMDNDLKKERSPFIHHHVTNNIDHNNIYGRTQASNGAKNVNEKFSSQAQNEPLQNADPVENSLESGSKFTPQRELQQKLMNEALQRIGDKKESIKKQFTKVTRTNPTIAAMEIMTRKEIKQGEMEQRLARGEVPQIPIPSTPPHMKQGVFKENLDGKSFSEINKQNNNIQIQKISLEEAKQIQEKFEWQAQQQKSNNAAMLALLEQQTQKLKSSEQTQNLTSTLAQQILAKPLEQSKMINNSSNIKEQPKMSKKAALPNQEIDKQPPIIVLKKEPKRLDPSEIKARSMEAEKEKNEEPKFYKEKALTPQPVKKSSILPNNSSEVKMINSGGNNSKLALAKMTANEEDNKPVKKLTNADKVAEALRASKAQTSPKIQTMSSSSNGSKISKPEMTVKRGLSQTPTKLIAEVKPMSKISDVERKRDSDEISESEFSRQSVRKAAERFEKVALEESSQRAPPPTLSSLGPRGRSKSIGHSLAQKLQEADEETVKPGLPWASNMSADEQVNIFD